MICVYNRPNDHNATIIRYIGCIKSAGYTRICVVTQNVHKNTKLQDHQNKQNGFYVYTFATNLQRVLSWKTQQRKVFDLLIDLFDHQWCWRPWWHRPRPFILLTFHSVNFSMREDLVDSTGHHEGACIVRAGMCRTYRKALTSCRKLLRKLLASTTHESFVARWDLGFEVFWGPLQAE